MANIPVTGITLNKSTTSLAVGYTETLIPIISPPNATEKSVIWDSDDNFTATVDQNGTVTAVSQGTANITATTLDGDFEASCLVTVTNV